MTELNPAPQSLPASELSNWLALLTDLSWSWLSSHLDERFRGQFGVITDPEGLEVNERASAREWDSLSTSVKLGYLKNYFANYLQQPFEIGGAVPAGGGVLYAGGTQYVVDPNGSAAGATFTPIDPGTGLPLPNTQYVMAAPVPGVQPDPTLVPLAQGVGVVPTTAAVPTAAASYVPAATTTPAAQLVSAQPAAGASSSAAASSAASSTHPALRWAEQNPFLAAVLAVVGGIVLASAFGGGR